MDELDERYLNDYEEVYWDDLVAKDLVCLHDDIEWDIKNLESIKQVTIKYKNHEEFGGKAEFISDMISQIEEVYDELKEAIWNLYEIAK